MKYLAMSRNIYSSSNSDNLGAVYWALIAAVVISCILILSQRGEARLRHAVQSTSDDAISPIVSLAATPARAFENFLFSIEDRQRAFEENKVLREELQALREEQSSVALLKEKIDDYEKILSVNHDTEKRVSKIAARAISDIEGPFVRALLINSGQKEGIAKGDAIMSPEGMIGHVIVSGRSSSRVLRLDDISSRIPVMSERSKSVAILAGDNTDFPKLTFIERGMDWEIGDKVVTSGDEGQLPRGLHIGTVSKRDGDEFRIEITGLKLPLNKVYAPKFEEIEEPVSIPAQETEETVATGGALDDAQSQALVIEGGSNE